MADYEDRKSLFWQTKQETPLNVFIPKHFYTVLKNMALRMICVLRISLLLLWNFSSMKNKIALIWI